MKGVHYCKKTGLKKRAWSPNEDKKLIAYINKYRIWNWSEMSKAAGLSRSGKSCRLRWMNYLRPDLKRGSFSMEEVETIIKMHEARGNKWSEIARNLPGRTDNKIKNFWHTHLKKHSKKPIVPPSAKPLVKAVKHDKNRVAGLNTSLIIANDPQNLESFDYLAISAQSSIGNFSSASQDSSSPTDHGTGETKETAADTDDDQKNACSSTEDQLNGSLLQREVFFMEELYEHPIWEMGEAGFTSAVLLNHMHDDDQLQLQDSYGFYNDELTGFWSSSHF